MGHMSKLAAFFCGLLVTAASDIDDIDVANLDDECAGDDAACALGLLQVHQWIALIEGNGCPQGGPLPCERNGEVRHFKFPPGVFSVPRQVTVPANTIIEGANNPIDPSDKTIKPDYSSQTVFEATVGVSDGGACYCMNLARTWEHYNDYNNRYTCQDLDYKAVKKLRPGFLMYSNTKVKNIAYQGKDTLRPADNGALCGGGVFETPGCVHNQCCGGEHCDGFYGPLYEVGDGKPVSGITIENVRLNDYSSTPNLGSQLALWVAQTMDTQTPTRDITVKNLVAMFLHADGINFHGFVQDAVVDDSYIQNTGDDIYAVWGSHFDTRNIVFQNSVGVDAGRARSNHYGSCVAVYGAKEASFKDITCYAPPQNTHDCYDNKHNGETCNGCLGIIKQSFDANYGGSTFTFDNCKFYNLKSHQENGHWVYDLSDPTPTGRPLVCNNEWQGGGLTVTCDGYPCPK